jgi:hypothetical protein
LFDFIIFKQLLLLYISEPSRQLRISLLCHVFLLYPALNQTTNHLSVPFCKQMRASFFLPLKQRVIDDLRGKTDNCKVIVIFSSVAPTSRLTSNFPFSGTMAEDERHQCLT